MDKTAPNAANLSNTSNNTNPIYYNANSTGSVILRADLGDPANIVETAGIKKIGTISDNRIQ